MKRIPMTDEEVEAEIKRLTSDDDVRLARAERRIKYKRRQYLYQLRDLKRRGVKIRNNPEYAWLVEFAEGGSNDEENIERD